MKKQILTAEFLLLSLVFPLKVSSQKYDDIYVFGDSLSDTGNVFDSTTGAVPPSPPYFNGRFSNGLVWVEYLALRLGLKVNPNTNFAFGGATTGSGGIGFAGSLGLQQQIGGFTTQNPSANPNALYIVWAGINDYFSYFAGSVPNPNETVANLSAAVTSLAAVGARDIMVVNLPDLEAVPFARLDSQAPDMLSAFTKSHNSSLGTTLNSLSQELSSNINIIPLDVNSLFERIVVAPREFGLTNAINYCIKNLEVLPLDLPIPPVYGNPSEFVFWDPIHPTTVIHELIGELAFLAVVLQKLEKVW